MSLAAGEHITSRATFRDLATRHRVVPVIRVLLADGETPVSAYIKLAANRPGTFLLESAEHGRSWSRWSFVGCGAPAALTVDAAGAATWWGTVPEGAPRGVSPLQALAESLELLSTEPIPDTPPLTGGLVGYLGYEIIRHIERLPNHTVDDLQIPEMIQLLATDIAALDHHEGRIYLISNAVNWDGSDERVDEAYDEAVTRVNEMAARLASATPSLISEFDAARPNVQRQVSAQTYEQRVRSAVEEIRAGEAFQIVLSQRFELACSASALDVYRVLRTINPSPYMYLVHFPDGSGADGFGDIGFSVVGSSPEALVKVQDGHATMHPIAGSRPRGSTEVEDHRLAAELLADEKENAEHYMLVDLARNDLGRIARPGTVSVPELRRIERYSHIMHITSSVSCELADGKSALDAVLSTFPAGTLSGAPKPRAMEIIESLEDTRRGVYGGTVGYFDFAGNADLAIAIRSATLKNGTAYVQAGAGLVADSDPATEDAECRNKAMAVLRAVAAAETLRPISEIGSPAETEPVQS